MKNKTFIIVISTLTILLIATSYMCYSLQEKYEELNREHMTLINNYDKSVNEQTHLSEINQDLEATYLQEVTNLSKQNQELQYMVNLMSREMNMTGIPEELGRLGVTKVIVYQRAETWIDSVYDDVNRKLTVVDRFRYNPSQTRFPELNVQADNETAVLCLSFCEVTLIMDQVDIDCSWYGIQNDGHLVQLKGMEDV